MKMFTDRKRSLGQGNVYTGVCLSTGGSAQPPPVGRRGGVCPTPTTWINTPRDTETPPPPRNTWDMTGYG